MLQNDTVKAWLGGIEPAWTLLDQTSFDGLRHLPPAPTGSPIRLATDLSPVDVQRVPFAAGVAALLDAGMAGKGVKLTAAGNLPRRVVDDLIGRFAWPGFDRVEEFRFHKVINEPDFMPLHFARRAGELAGLLRRSLGHLKTSSRGRDAIKPANLPTLPALLLRLVMWDIDLTTFARGLHAHWPQRDVGVVLWSLSVCAGEWQTKERLTRLCTVPNIGVLEATWDSGTLAMEARILQPLLWFGLLEQRSEPIPGERFGTRHLYRKTDLFDRLIAFDISTEIGPVLHH